MGLPGADVEHLDIERSDESAAAISFHTQPAPRFHGSVPAMLEEVKKQIGESKRVLIAVPNTGEVERLADIFSEYAVSFRLGSRTRSGESYADETSYFSGEVLTATLAKAYVPDGVTFPAANLSFFAAGDLFVGSEALSSRLQSRNGKTATFFPDSRTLQWELDVSHYTPGHGPYQDIRATNQANGTTTFMRQHNPPPTSS